MIGKHRHIRINENAVATVSEDCTPETLKMLTKLVNIVEGRMNDITANMESRKILPVNKRLKDNKYPYDYNDGKHFKHLCDLTKDYHNALIAAENELFQLNLGCNSDKILPKYDRIKLTEYEDITKTIFTKLKSKIKKYHQALSNAEYHIINNSIGKKIKENHGKK